MEKGIFRNKIQPLSSYLNKGKNNTIILKNFDDEKIFKRNELKKNNSIDYDDLASEHRFHIIRKLTKSSHITQKLGNFERFMSNIRSSENIYKDMHLKKSPSLNKNLSEIHSLIKGKRYKNIKLIDSYFFNSNFKNGYMDDYYKIKENNSAIKSQKYKLKPIQRNHSCRELIDISKRLHKAIKSDDTPQLSTNISKITNIKKPNSKFIDSKLNVKNLKHNTSNISTTTNKSIITNKIPDFLSNSNSKICINDKNTSEIISEISLPKIKTNIEQKSIIPRIDSYNSSQFESEKLDNESPKSESTKNESCFITNLNTDKMRFNINKLLIEKKKERIPIDQMEERILKMKIFQNYQKESLEKYLNDERFKMDEKIDHIIKMYKMYENNYRNYSIGINRYINYLFNLSNQFEIDLRVSNKKKKDIYYDIEVLVDKLVTKQKEFEYLISTRNFIFWVKNIGKKVVKMNNQYIYKISKRRKFVDDLFEMFGKTEDSFAFKYLKKIIPIEQLENIITRENKRKTVTRRQSTIRQSVAPVSKKEKIDDELIPPPPGEKIFETPEEFIKVLESLQNNDIELLKEYEISLLEKGILINELNNENELYEEYEKSHLYSYLKMDIKNLESEKNKNKILKNKYEQINNQIKNKNDLSSLKQDFNIMSFNAFNNLSFYNVIKYNKLRIKYKFEGLTLLEKLINNISEIFSMNKTLNLFDLNEVYNYIPYENLVELLKIKKENFNNNNQYLIKVYTLQLMKLYIYFCQITIKKDVENKKLYAKIYNNIKDKVLVERKINKTKIIKKMGEEKREIEMKRLNEKWNREIKSQNRKCDLDIRPKIQIKNLEKTASKKKENENEKDEINKYNEIFED